MDRILAAMRRNVTSGQQVRAIQPAIGAWIGPPCWARKRAKLTR